MPLPDSSDWWSVYADSRYDRTIEPDGSFPKVQHRLPDAANFTISGISLGRSHNRDFPDVKRRFGNATVVSRGDGAKGRDQICYVSSDESEKVHLIFEEGELEDAFYLFAGGPGWRGSDLCVASPLVSSSLGNAAGIHLGQTLDEVERLLGAPSSSDVGRRVYSFEGQRRMTAEEVKAAGSPFPPSNWDDFMFTIDVQIIAKFDHSRLTYLYVSKSEVN